MVGSHALAAFMLLIVQAVSQSPEKQRMVDEATVTQRRAVELSPLDAGAYHELGMAYRQHKFMRAASGAFATAVSLRPADAALRLDYATAVSKTGDLQGAKTATLAAIDLDPTSASAYSLLAQLERSSPEAQERAARAALQLDPSSASAVGGLAHLLNRQRRHQEVETLYRGLQRARPHDLEARKKLFEHLRFADRKIEAAVAYRSATLAAARDADERGGGERGGAMPLSSEAKDWQAFVDSTVARAPSAAPKCLARECIEGLVAALEEAEAHPSAAELSPPHDAASVLRMLSGQPVPTVLRAAGDAWGPSLRWDAAHLERVAGNEELEVTVVEVEGAFEVRADRIERPPKSVMRLGDFVRLLATRKDANLTLYSRQASLWPMTGLLADLAPMPWMRPLRLNDLNFWLGDGHFRNTLHFDPYDNFLCQVRGSKHVMLWPPQAKEDLYYGRRRDIQASYVPSRGEYGRFDTGIVSDNTAEVNGAAPDLERFPRFARAAQLQSYAQLNASDCLYLPNGWHHHVFSEADLAGGYNLALNLWISREATLSQAPPQPARIERFPTLAQVTEAISAGEIPALGGRAARLGRGQLDAPTAALKEEV